jgi:hypothetical protein
MEYVGRPGVKDLPYGTKTQDPVQLIFPDNDFGKQLELGSAAALSLVNRGLGLSFFLTSMMTTGNPAEYLQIYVMMPADAAKDRQPVEVAAEAILDGLRSLLKFTELERTQTDGYTAKGGEACGDDGCLIKGLAFTDRKGLQKLLMRSNDKAPSWTGINGPIYTMKAVQPQIQKLGPKGSGLSLISEKTAILLSAVLPDYFYVYLPSGDSKFPSVVLNRGKVHFAVSPEN